MNIDCIQKYIENVIMRFDLYRIYCVYIYIYNHHTVLSLVYTLK